MFGCFLSPDGEEDVYILFICLDFKILFMCVNVLPARVYAHLMCGVPGVDGGQSGHWVLWTEVTDSCEFSCESGSLTQVLCKDSKSS